MRHDLKHPNATTTCTRTNIAFIIKFDGQKQTSTLFVCRISLSASYTWCCTRQVDCLFGAATKMTIDLSRTASDVLLITPNENIVSF